MKPIYLAAAFVAIASTATAQDMDNTATSQSYSQSGIWNEGDVIRSFSTAAPSTNSTADCVIAVSAIAVATGRVGHECNTKKEAAIMRDLAALRYSPNPIEREQARAAITYLARNDRSMRDTMLVLGWVQ